jgi:flavin-dependent dehydrogenase
MPILNKLVSEEVQENLPKATCNPYLEFTPEVEALPAYNGLTGDVLFKLPHPGGRRISRQGLRKVLADGLDIKWGAKLEGMEPSDEHVRLTFAGGETFEADFVVGADGASSKVRELLLGVEAAKPKLSGLTFATGLVKYGDLGKIAFVNKLHPVAAMVFFPEGVGGCGGKLAYPLS